MSMDHKFAVMTATQIPIMVFTDLDGTLLDHETYSYEAANEALGLLRANSIPLILASSKTAAEIAPLREQLGFSNCPAIVENGAGILDAGKAALTDKASYSKLLEAIANVDSTLRDCFRGFSQFTAEEIAQATSLSLAAAKLAKDRQFSEPGIWSGNSDNLARFKQRLADMGIVAQQGGRFISLSLGGNKADRLKEIATAYTNATGDIHTIALGDSLNDIKMLKAATRGIIVANPHGVHIPVMDEEHQGTISRTSLTGPSGWNKAVIDVLKNIGRI